MSGPVGRLTRDLFGQSLHILGKLVLDPECNLVVANSTQKNAHILGNLYTSHISEQINGAGITVDGNLIITSPHTLSVDVINADIYGNITCSTITPEGNAIVVLGNVFIDTPGTSLVVSNIFTQNLVENQNDDGINMFGNVTLPNYFRLNTRYIKERDAGQGVNVQGNLKLTGDLFIAGLQVVGSQQADIPNNDGTLGDVAAKLNSVLAVLRTHGLIG